MLFSPFDIEKQIFFSSVTSCSGFLQTKNCYFWVGAFFFFLTQLSMLSEVIDIALLALRPITTDSKDSDKFRGDDIMGK